MRVTIEFKTELRPVMLALELDISDVVALQRTITSSNSAGIKDRIFDSLTKFLNEHQIPGGLYTTVEGGKKNG